MKLALKIQLAIIAAIIVIMAGAAYVHVLLELSDYEAHMVQDHESLAAALRDSAEAVWRRDGERSGEQLMTTVSRGQRSIRARLVDPTVDAAGSLASVAPDAARSAFKQGRITHVRSAGSFCSYAPLSGVSPSPRVVETTEPVSYERPRIQASIVHNSLISAAMILASGLVTGAVGYFLIGRPMRELEGKARRVGAGGLSGSVGTRRTDEIGSLAREMDSMCARLDEARRAVAAEAGSRIEALEQLRHVDRLRTVGQLASGLAHELGTPLNLILGRAELIEDPEATREESVQNARIIAEQTRKMTALVRQLLDFARRRGPEPRVVDLRNVWPSTRGLRCWWEGAQLFGCARRNATTASMARGFCEMKWLPPRTVHGPQLDRRAGAPAIVGSHGLGAIELVFEIHGRPGEQRCAALVASSPPPTVSRAVGCSCMCNLSRTCPPWYRTTGSA